MIDLDKEFRTLRLLSSVFIILGVGLIIGGFGLTLLMSDPAMNERKSSRTPVVETSNEATTKPSPKEMKEKFSTSTSQIGTPTGVLGVLMLIGGLILRYIIRSNYDESDEAQSNPELFRAYAAQLVLAEQNRAKKNAPPESH
ncbi:MAG: hypothetical protein WCT04_23905 [Planctomycetota bacterium]